MLDSDAHLSRIGELTSSIYMSETPKKWSDRFFRWNGMEGWNRGARAMAASVAERIFAAWAKEGVDLDDPAQKARFERSYGRGVKPSDIRLDADGYLDITDERNQAAVQRWVMDAIVTPTAANRPVWASHPAFAVFMHMKNFTYAFHRVLLANVADQARLGNMRPAVMAALGMVPFMIASGVAKEMLTPGDEPPWMQGWLDGYLSYGWDRAGLLGVPQMYGNWLFRENRGLFPQGVGVFAGPMADQMEDLFIGVPFGDRTLGTELLGGLPGGNLTKRLAA